MSSNADPNARRTESEELSARVLALALREVRRTYLEYNQSLFGGRLLSPTFEWTEHQGEWGAWLGAHRTIRLSRRLLGEGWGVLTEVLKHEMAHQYVEEVERISRAEGPHGATFQRVCSERGIDASATGRPEEAAGTSAETQKILARISHLLALAQSDNQHEAESAMLKARRLMLKYNLEHAGASSHSAYRFKHLGTPTGRRMAWQRVLATLLSDFFFVEVIIVPVYRAAEGKRGSVIEICGTEANLEIAAYSYDFLERAALGCWKKHKKEQGLMSDQHKQSFLYGVMSGFAEKLDRESKKTQKEGLIWLGDPDLGRYFRARHPHVRHVSGRGSVQGDAYSAGRDAGGRIVLHRGVEAPRSGGAPRLLGRAEI